MKCNIELCVGKDTRMGWSPLWPLVSPCLLVTHLCAASKRFAFLSQCMLCLIGDPALQPCQTLNSLREHQREAAAKDFSELSEMFVACNQESQNIRLEYF